MDKRERKAAMATADLGLRDPRAYRRLAAMIRAQISSGTLQRVGFRNGA
jgi:hypothetical protein